MKNKFQKKIYLFFKEKDMKKLLLFYFLFVCLIIQAQEKYYTNPLKIPMLLSGSFAELRTNHFHSGVDIKTQGVTGLPVYAVADGYISRVVVSSSGFGKAIYVDHPNGTTSVYAHLKSFYPAIKEYVIDQQYNQESFRLDLQIPAFLFPVEKGAEIAKSGNSGSSGGPHLHFEIRDTQTEETLNALDYGFEVKDNIPPKFFSLLVVPLSDSSYVDSKQKSKSYPVVFYDGRYHLKDNRSITIQGKVGFAVQVNDYFNGTHNKCGINQLILNIDGETHFSFNLNRFAFHNSRYINSHIVYEEYVHSRRRFIKTWTDPGNQLPIYNYNLSQGTLCANNKFHSVEIEIADSYNNTSVLEFRTNTSKNKLPASVKSGNYTEMLYNKENFFESESCQLNIPQGALYKSLDFTYSTQKSDEYFSDIHLAHDNTVPLHVHAIFKIKPINLPERLQSKVVIVNIDPDKGSVSAVGGKYNNNWVETKIRRLGAFAVTVDTIPPVIKAISIKDGKLIESNRIRFRISDDLSGIDKITGLLDGEWVLFDYDAKNNLITHFLDKERFMFGKRHAFKLTVTDYRGNASVYESSFWE